MREITIETTIKGGLPVLAIMDYEPVDREMGILLGVLSDPWICWMSGKKVTKKVYESISQSELERIMVEGLEEVQNYNED